MFIWRSNTTALREPAKSKVEIWIALSGKWKLCISRNVQDKRPPDKNSHDILCIIAPAILGSSTNYRLRVHLLPMPHVNIFGEQVETENDQLYASYGINLYV